MRKLQVPISEKAILDLHVGDVVSLSGTILTARDRAHKYFIETFIQADPPPSEQALYATLREILHEGVIYHCGPIVRQVGDSWEFVAAGPTTSIREEPYQADVIAHFGLRAVIGKGGMGPRTLKACQEHKAVYLHAIGGAASLIARSVQAVEAVYKLEFGVPEAMWRIRVEDFRATVTLDAHGGSLHQEIARTSEQKLHELLGLEREGTLKITPA